MKSSIAAPLVAWFEDSARDLPWRRTLDPYAIWVSEVMLQQTQVATVVPYWTRWMRELPDVHALAAASGDTVLKLWEGLGYYRRARHLHEAAREVVETRAGSLPAHLEGWLSLPGIGRYTAGAIVSIAFNQPAPILDGNVVRVLSRVMALPGDPASKALRDSLWETAGKLVSAAGGLPSPGRLQHAPQVQISGPCSALNQALMELGATVCSPAGPDCPACPIAASCRARKLGRPEDFPHPSQRPRPTRRTMAAVLWESSGNWLVRRRPDDAVNGGLWEFPAIECGPGDDPRASLAGWLGIDGVRLSAAGTVRHSITRFRIEQHLFKLDGPALDGCVPQGGEWRPRSDLDSLAWTGAHRKALKLLGN